MTLLEFALIASAVWMTSAIIWRIRYEKRRRAE